MQKYQQVFQQMLSDRPDLFDTFRSIHDAYALSPAVNQEKFNAIGREVKEVIEQYERILCGKTESGQYGKFSHNLSQKFWDEVRKVYPKIDFVGVIIT